MKSDGSYISHSKGGVGSMSDVYSVKFWYSRRSVIAFVASLFLIVQGLSSLIPPFQSPDEIYHLERAYLLSEGVVVLDKENGISGGNIDTGLLEYMDHFRQDRWFPYRPSATTSDTKPTLANGIHWTGKAAFRDVPNVAVYFPLPYIPQAIALKIGKSAGLTVPSSYYLARWLSLIASLCILCVACFLYPVSPMVFALFLMPMTIFQLGTASLDAISFSTVVLTGSLYMRAATKEYTFENWMLVLLSVSLFSLATTRVNLIFFTLLPCVLYRVRRSHGYLISSAVVLTLSLVWTAFSVATVGGGHGNSPELRSQIVAHYLHHAGEFFVVIYDTVSNGTLLRFYWEMFVGVFGWSGINYLDGDSLRKWGIFLHPSVYVAFAVLLATIAIVSFRWSRSIFIGRPALWLILAAFSSAFLILPILLATWTPQPAKFIYGIQGRYFIPTAILFSFALPAAHASRLAVATNSGLLFVAASISVTAMAPALLATWWVN